MPLNDDRPATGMPLLTARGRVAVVATLIALLGATSLLTPTAADTPAPVSDEDAARAGMGDVVPGFGGAFFDRDTGTWRVLLRNPTTAALQSAVTALADGNTDIGPHNAVAVAANYSFQDLKTWHDRMIDVLSIDGVVYTDIAESENAIVVGLEDVADMAPAVRAHLEGVGVPLKAVEFKQFSPIHTASSVADRHRPMVGGLQIQFQNEPGLTGGTGICTLGFIAVRSGVTGFVTNSHCSRTQGQVDDARYWQADRPFPLDVDQVGHETVDPGFFTGGVCPANRRCRYSDANFVQKTPEVESSRGRVARPALNQLAWNDANTWRVTAERTPSEGQVVNKVGRTTGRTRGPVTIFCGNFNVAGTNITMLCNHFADAAGDQGDSGAPLVRVSNTPNEFDVELGGVVWGVPVDGIGIAFSGIPSIQTDLGAMNTCAAGLSC